MHSRAGKLRGVIGMQKSLIRTAACLLAAVLLTQCVFAAPETSAQSAILTDADTGDILYEHNAYEPSLIASTTKIMTALLALENCALQREFVIPPEAVGVEGSSLYLKEGERLTVEALLYGMMLHSGNDAAVALAICCGGSVERFVAMMNEKAESLGLTQTSFANPNGLDSAENYSTAADLAKLTAYALQNDDFVRIVSKKSITIGGRSLTNHNRLLWQAEGILGVKTGYTRAAGRILVSAAERKGRRLIAVTIRDGDDWRDHTALFDFGFSRYEMQTAIHAGEAVGAVGLMTGGAARLVAAEAFSFAGADALCVEIRYPKAAFCAGETGSEAGWADVYLGQRRVGTIRLLWGGTELEGTNTENHCRARLDVPSGG